VVRITYVGHATIQIEADGVRLLTDPVLRSRILHIRRFVPLDEPPGLLEPDAVLISHAHIDHLDPSSLRRLRPCRVIAPVGTSRTLLRAGMRDITVVRPGERARIDGLGVTAMRVAHAGARYPLSGQRDALGYLVECESPVFFAGDTDLFDEMDSLAGAVDVALIPIWGWGPSVGPGHLDPPRGAEAVARLKPRIAIPIHWGTLAAPGVRWLSDPDRPAREFERNVARLAPDVEVRVLPPGASTQVVKDQGADASSRRNPPG
jgi:L-ascorbate metabolism protein UlaG (beta-lactamase superfamily)